MTEGGRVSVAGVAHAFAGATPVEVLRGVSLEVPAGAFVSIVGPSGCGKSTLLRILAGLIEADAGTARVDGRVAFMPQRDLLLPWRRAEGNAILGATLGGVSRAEALTRARTLFPAFGLAGFERAWPGQLSGGMRQRLAMLRTFLTPASALLLDEPFGALDAITRRQMQQWLQQVWAEDSRTVLLVTHDIEEALILSDCVYVMSPRPGTITACVEVDLPRPRATDDLTSPRFVALKERLLRALGAS